MHSVIRRTAIAVASMIFVALLFGVTQISGQDTRAPRANSRFTVSIPNAELGRLRVGAAVFILGEPVGTVRSLDYARDGQHVTAELDIKPGWSAKIVRCSRIGVAQFDDETVLEIKRGCDPLGMIVQQRRNGIQVKSVAAGGPAEAAGTQPGDEILAVNTQETKTVADLADAMSDVEAGGTVLRLKLRRENKPLSVTARADREFALAALEPNQSIPFGGTQDAAATRLAGATQSLDQVLPKIEYAVDEANDFMANIGEKGDTLMDDFGEITESLKEMTAQADEMMQVIQTEMQYAPGSMMELRDMITNAAETMQKAGGMVSKIEGMLDKTSGVMDEANSTAAKTGEIVDAVRNQFIVRRMVERNQRRNYYTPNRRRRWPR